VEAAARLGLGGYLVKPIKRKELYAALDKILIDDTGGAASTPQVASSNIVRRAILLVEDNPDNRLLVRAYLKNQPFDLDEAENGAEALLRCQSRVFDLVLMDVQMPVMDGHTATRKIREYEAENARKPVPIIALTAHAVKEEVDRSFAAGCNAHLAKPIKKQTLLAALAEHLS
jgi:CheY-like chemotaxis protein